MANLEYVKENRLTQEAKGSRKTVLMFGAPILLLLCVLFPDVWWWFLSFFVILLLNAGTIKRAGAQGEDTALARLKDLPDTYTIFNQLEVPNNNSRRGFVELDLVVVGPNGVFVVEVKNNNRAVGAGGGRCTADLRSP